MYGKSSSEFGQEVCVVLGFLGAVFCGCFCIFLRTPVPVEFSFPNVHEIHKISWWIWHLQVLLFNILHNCRDLGFY